MQQAVNTTKSKMAVKHRHNVMHVQRANVPTFVAFLIYCRPPLPLLEEEGAQVDHVKTEMKPEQVERLKS